MLAAVGADDGLVVFEREPGGDLVRRPIVRGSSLGEPEIVLRDDGAAVVSWGAATAVTAMVRTGPGAFGAPVTLTEAAPPRPNRDRGFGVGLIGVDEGDPPYEGQPWPRATLGADGRALLGWGIQDAGVRAATVTAAGQAERQTLATAVRDQGGITPLVLADGRRAVAWTDNAPIFSVPPYAGRVHLALEDAPAPPPVPAPELRVGAPRDRSLRPAQALLLPVRCSAACDVRATLDDDPVDDPGASLASAGTAWLRFRPSSTPLAPRRPGTVRVVVRWSAPGSSVVRSSTERVRLRRLPPPRLPRILALRARRLSGDRVEVRWRTDASDGRRVLVRLRQPGQRSEARRGRRGLRQRAGRGPSDLPCRIARRASRPSRVGDAQSARGDARAPRRACGFRRHLHRLFNPARRIRVTVVSCMHALPSRR